MEEMSGGEGGAWNAPIWAKTGPPFNFHPWGNTIPHVIGKFHLKGFVGTMPLALDCFVTKYNIGINLPGRFNMETIGEYILSTGEMVELLQNREVGEFGVRFYSGATAWFSTMGELLDFVERYKER